jgi:hypothetical protein
VVRPRETGDVHGPGEKQDCGSVTRGLPSVSRFCVAGSACGNSHTRTRDGKEYREVTKVLSPVRKW